jgi:hypothetical protein
MVVPRGAPGSVVMRVAPLAVTNAALTFCAVLTWVYGTANAQDKGTLNPDPLGNPSSHTVRAAVGFSEFAPAAWT